jgi:FG-GAP repeat
VGTLVLAACGGGGGGGAATLAPSAPTGLGVSYGVKVYVLTWSAPAATGSHGAASYYQVAEDPDGSGDQAETTIQASATATADPAQSSTVTLPSLLTRLNAQYRVRACNAGGCSAYTPAITPDLNRAVGYFKASNAQAGDFFGYVVALSSDGNTLAVGADREASNATGIGGDQGDNSAVDAGAVYVFTRSGNTWSQQAYVKASNAGAGDNFGRALALSADGNTLAAGAARESSSATGIDGNQADNTAGGSGAVYVFTRSGSTWSQQAYVKASNTGVDDRFGVAVALSSDGNTLAVGANREASNATGIGGNQADNSTSNAGAVYVFARSGGSWNQQAYVKASNTGAQARFGGAVALSNDGSTLAVGAATEASSATGIDGNQADSSTVDAGAVYVFTRSGSTWSQQAYVKASNTEANDSFGLSLTMSGDGNTLAVGAYREASNATGIGGDQANNSAASSGAVYVFSRSGSTWTQQAYMKASNTGADDCFGLGVALSNDGNTLAVGAFGEDSRATGIDGDPADNGASDSGAVYVFKRSGSSWTQQAYVKASTTEPSDQFGYSVSLSGDGSTLAAGANGERSDATGVGGDQTDNTALSSGAVFVY